MRLLYGQDEAVEKFVSALIPECREYGFGECRGIGVIDADGKLAAGMLYHDWSPDAATIEISGASVSPGWATRKTVGGLFAYPFLINCQMVFARARADNIATARLLSGVGFIGTPIPRLYGRNTDGVLWALTDEQWKSSRYHL